MADGRYVDTARGDQRVLAERREWRTLAVAAAVYATWVIALATHGRTPAAVTVALLSWTGAWHLSLQHETIHGHPFRDRRFGHALGWVPLTVWLPYHLYRVSHLAHHAADLTDPVDDPESFYLGAEEFASCHPLWRWVVTANRTLAFRLLVWSAIGTLAYVANGIGECVAGAPKARRTWATHTLGAAAVLTLAVGVAGVPMWQYVLGAVYGARVLNLVRSFAEHRWVPGDAPRTAVVDAGRVMSLLMLNLNLHLAHHEAPAVAWYDLPAEARRTDAARRAATGAGHYPGGYAEIVRRYAIRPFCQAEHPSGQPSGATPSAAPAPVPAPAPAIAPAPSIAPTV